MRPMQDCYDPRLYGEDDEVEEVDCGEGEKVTLRKDWFRPPKYGRGPCTNREVPEPCSCGGCMEPQGVSALLHWDKINLINRFIFNKYICILPSHNFIFQVHLHTDACVQHTVQFINTKVSISIPPRVPSFQTLKCPRDYANINQNSLILWFKF